MMAARLYLALPALVSLFMAAALAYTFLAITKPNTGPMRPLDWTWAAMVGVLVLLVHGGYLAAPLAIGTSWHRLAMWAMLPLAIPAAAVLLFDARWVRALLSTEAASVRGVGRMGFALVIYIAPPVLMWMTRPGTLGATTATP